MLENFRIQIPSGWAVLRNLTWNFQSIEDLYTEDILSIESIIFEDERWVTDQNGYLLDLGWYDNNSTFTVRLIKGGWDNVIVEYSSPNFEIIQNQVLRILGYISSGISHENIRLLIK